MSMRTPDSRPDLTLESQTESVVEDTATAPPTALPALSPKNEAGGQTQKTSTGKAAPGTSFRNWFTTCLHKLGPRKLLGIVLGILLLLGAASFAPNAAALLFHNPQHFRFAEGPQDGQYRFDSAILAVPSFGGSGRHHFESGSFSSSNHPEIRTLTWGVIKTDAPKRHPLKEALLPQKMPIVQGAIAHEQEVPSNQIVHSPNCLVDISSLSASVFSLPRAVVDRIKDFGLIDVGAGDYITNQLTLRTQLRHLSKGRVRIFVQDEPGLAQGITIDSGSVYAKPADFQIWYNGPGRIKLTGVSSLSCVIYAPHADVEIGPEVSFKGAIVCRNAYADGGSLFFDRDLKSITDWQ